MVSGAIANPVNDSTIGAVIFKYTADSEVFVSQPRVKRTATLDGGAVFDHQGYSIGDRTIDIRAKVTETEAVNIWALYEDAIYLILHTGAGSFYGAISDLRIDRGEMRLTFLVKEAA